MNIMVTGGAGYVGTLLSKKLIEEGNNVTIFDNFMYGYDSVLHLIDSQKINIIKSDITTVSKQHLKNIDVVYHLAGISGLPACKNNPEQAYKCNVEGTKHLTKLLDTSQALIYASTTSMYGNAGKIVNEESNFHPASIYAKTKYEGEQIVLHEHQNSVSLRFATIFGTSPKMRLSTLMVNNFVYRAIKEGYLVLFNPDHKRTFIHIDDAINAYDFALTNFSAMKSQIYNIGDEVLNYSKLEIAQAIQEYVDFKLLTVSKADFDVRNFIVDFSKIKKIGYHTNNTLDEGIKSLTKLYSFFEANPFSND